MRLAVISTTSLVAEVICVVLARRGHEATPEPRMSDGSQAVDAWVLCLDGEPDTDEATAQTRALVQPVVVIDHSEQVREHVAHAAAAYFLADTPIETIVAGIENLDSTGQTRAVKPPPGLSKLTARELQTLRGLATGQSTAALAASMAIKRHTARGYVHNVMWKLGVHNRVEAAVIGYQLGLTTGPESTSPALNALLTTST